MSSQAVVGAIAAGGVIAIIRLPSGDDLLPVAEAIREGGVPAIEFTLNTPGALQALERTRGRLGEAVRLGVGTVLSAEAARDAVRSGAEFLVAPNLNPEVIRIGREADVVVIPGAFTPSEVAAAHEAGASLVKVFPVTSVGPRYIADLRGPLPHIPLVPTGGITGENAGEYLRAGATALGVGGVILSRELVERRAYREIAERARAFMELVRRARGQAETSAQPIRPVEGPDTR